MTSDGGQIALDWVYPQPKTGFTETNQPTVILLPGLTGQITLNNKLIRLLLM